jgi:hypothetical protein
VPDAFPTTDSLAHANFSVDATPMPENAVTLHPMQVFVRISCGNTIALEVYASDTTLSVKAKIQSAAGFPPDAQRLVHASSTLDDTRSLASYGITKESTLGLLLRLRGGMDWWQAESLAATRASHARLREAERLEQELVLAATRASQARLREAERLDQEHALLRSLAHFPGQRPTTTAAQAPSAAPPQVPVPCVAPPAAPSAPLAPTPLPVTSQAVQVCVQPAQRQTATQTTGAPAVTVPPTTGGVRREHESDAKRARRRANRVDRLRRRRQRRAARKASLTADTDSTDWIPETLHRAPPVPPNASDTSVPANASDTSTSQPLPTNPTCDHRQAPLAENLPAKSFADAARTLPSETSPKVSTTSRVTAAVPAPWPLQAQGVWNLGGDKDSPSLCAAFRKGTCSAAQCPLRHAWPALVNDVWVLGGTPGAAQRCHDFSRSGCTRANCYFRHVQPTCRMNPCRLGPSCWRSHAGAPTHAAKTSTKAGTATSIVPPVAAPAKAPETPAAPFKPAQTHVDSAKPSTAHPKAKTKTAPEPTAPVFHNQFAALARRRASTRSSVAKSPCWNEVMEEAESDAPADQPSVDRTLFSCATDASSTTHRADADATPFSRDADASPANTRANADATPLRATDASSTTHRADADATPRSCDGWRQDH